MHATSPIATTRSRQSLLAISMTLLLVLATAAPAFRASGTAYAAPAAATAATTCTQCTTNVSGTVTAYAKATATANGSITIGGTKYVIKAGTTLSATIKVGVYVSLRLTLNASGQVTACAVISVKVSGLITAFVPATPLTTGKLVIGGQSFVIAKGASLSLSVGLNVTLTLTLNSAGQVTSCGCN